MSLHRNDAVSFSAANNFGISSKFKKTSVGLIAHSVQDEDFCATSVTPVTPSSSSFGILSSSRTNDIRSAETTDFSELLLKPEVLQGLQDAGFRRPSPIQLKTIPSGRCGMDLIIQAKSGTGKTLVFAVIALETVELSKQWTQVVVVAPTREVATQGCETIKAIGLKLPGLKVGCFIGGTELKDKKKISKMHIVIGSPGRLCQLMQENVINVDHVRLFVLDEADQLMEDSYVNNIKWMFGKLPAVKQVMVLSATYPHALDTILTEYMRSPERIQLNSENVQLDGAVRQDETLKKKHVDEMQNRFGWLLVSVLNLWDPYGSPLQLFQKIGIKQYFLLCGKTGMKGKEEATAAQNSFAIRVNTLAELLLTVSYSQCIIFCASQTRVDDVSAALNERHLVAEKISANLSQDQRTKIMKRLMKSYQCRLLVSTDLTARGIDAEHVNLVINFDVPFNAETYFHRIGRAGRFGGYGAAITLLHAGDNDQKFYFLAVKGKFCAKRLPEEFGKEALVQQTFWEALDVVDFNALLADKSLLTVAKRQENTLTSAVQATNGYLETEVPQLANMRHRHLLKAVRKNPTVNVFTEGANLASNFELSGYQRSDLEFDESDASGFGCQPLSSPKPQKSTSKQQRSSDVVIRYTRLELITLARLLVVSTGHVASGNAQPMSNVSKACEPELASRLLPVHAKIMTAKEDIPVKSFAALPVAEPQDTQTVSQVSVKDLGVLSSSDSWRERADARVYSRSEMADIFNQPQCTAACQSWAITSADADTLRFLVKRADAPSNGFSQQSQFIHPFSFKRQSANHLYDQQSRFADDFLKTSSAKARAVAAFSAQLEAHSNTGGCVEPIWDSGDSGAAETLRSRNEERDPSAVCTSAVQGVTSATEGDSTEVVNEQDLSARVSSKDGLQISAAQPSHAESFIDKSTARRTIQQKRVSFDETGNGRQLNGSAQVPDNEDWPAYSAASESRIEDSCRERDGGSYRRSSASARRGNGRQNGYGEYRLVQPKMPQANSSSFPYVPMFPELSDDDVRRYLHSLGPIVDPLTSRRSSTSSPVSSSTHSNEKLPTRSRTPHLRQPREAAVDTGSREADGSTLAADVLPNQLQCSAESPASGAQLQECTANTSTDAHTLTTASVSNSREQKQSVVYSRSEMFEVQGKLAGRYNEAIIRNIPRAVRTEKRFTASSFRFTVIAGRSLGGEPPISKTEPSPISVAAPCTSQSSGGNAIPSFPKPTVQEEECCVWAEEPILYDNKSRKQLCDVPPFKLPAISYGFPRKAIQPSPGLISDYESALARARANDVSQEQLRQRFVLQLHAQQEEEARSRKISVDEEVTQCKAYLDAIAYRFKTDVALRSVCADDRQFAAVKRLLNSHGVRSVKTQTIRKALVSTGTTSDAATVATKTTETADEFHARHDAFTQTVVDNVDCSLLRQSGEDSNDVDLKVRQKQKVVSANWSCLIAGKANDTNLDQGSTVDKQPKLVNHVVEGNRRSVLDNTDGATKQCSSLSGVCSSAQQLPVNNSDQKSRPLGSDAAKASMPLEQGHSNNVGACAADSSPRSASASQAVASVVAGERLSSFALYQAAWSRWYMTQYMPYARESYRQMTAYTNLMLESHKKKEKK